MPINIEKKSEQILINVTPSMYKLLAKIAEIESRPVGYVARELMARGTDLYVDDGKLREIDSRESAIAAVREAIKRAIPANIGEEHLIEVKDNVAAHISTGNAERDEIQRTINEAEIAEAKRRTTPRKTMNVSMLKQKAK